MEKTIELARVPVGIELHSTDALPTLGPYLTDRPPALRVRLSDRERERARARYGPEASEAYLEFMELCYAVSDGLLPFRRVVFHGTAFFWRGRVWILTGPSGTGKTTHYLHWKALWDREVEILCGDKPILAFDGPEITVHPSPWNGKEAMGQLRSGPLGGIVVLRQSGTDRIRRLARREAVWPLFPQFLFRRATAAQVQAVGRMEEQLLSQVPVWLLENRGGGASALLCRNALLEV